MHLTLIVPGLAATLVDAGPNAGAPLARFARRTGAPRVERAGLVHAVAASLGTAAPERTAPLRALGAGLDPGDDFLLAADPVAFAAGRDDVRFDARIDDLDAGDAAALVAALVAHFASDGLAFVAPRPDAWFVRTPREFDVQAAAVDALAGRPLAEAMPRGADGRAWRRWQSEIQMLLHEHPVNARREAAGLRPVNGVWIWGGGRRSPVAPGPAARVFVSAADPVADLLAGVALARGERAAPSPARYGDSLAVPGAGGTALPAVVHLPAAANAADVAKLADAWIDPAARALERGRWRTMTLIGDGRGTAVAWEATAPRGLARWWRGRERTILALPDKDD